MADTNQYWTGHRERLRVRAEGEGLDSLKDREILELLLFYAVPRADVNDVARLLLESLGSIEAVLHAPPEALRAVPGVTASMAEWIMMTGELHDAYLGDDPNEDLRIWRFRDVMFYLAGRWRREPAPRCWMIYTDFEDRLITHSVICDSLCWADPRYACEIVEESLALHARHAVLIMFVGTGPLEFEPSDKKHLVDLANTMSAIDVELLDCVMVGEQGYLSMSLEGWMEEIRRDSDQPELHERYRSE